MAILAGLALPAYQRYIDRAHLAEVMVMYDALRTKSRIAARAAGDLCKWTYQDPGSTAENVASKRRAELIKEAANTVNPQRWDRGYIQQGNFVNGEPYTVQFGAQADPVKVRQVRLLAEEMQKVGVFAEWTRNTPGGAIFTAFLGSCKATSPTPPIPLLPAIKPSNLSQIAPAASVPKPATMPPTSIPLPFASAPVSAASAPAGNLAVPAVTASVPSSVASAPLPGTTTSTVTPASQTPPAQTQSTQPRPPALEQCTTQCRVSYPHGNSNAYRACIAQCK